MQESLLQVQFSKGYLHNLLANVLPGVLILYVTTCTLPQQTLATTKNTEENKTSKNQTSKHHNKQEPSRNIGKYPDHHWGWEKISADFV